MTTPKTAVNPTANALEAYLGSRTATGRWFEAHEHESPLVGARRGTAERWANSGIRYHRVVVKTLWLVRYVKTQIVEHGVSFGGPVSGGRVLLGHLVELPGVTEVHNITPLLDTTGPHRVLSWFAVDPETWPVRLAPEVAKAVNDPWSVS